MSPGKGQLHKSERSLEVRGEGESQGKGGEGGKGVQQGDSRGEQGDVREKIREYQKRWE